jgi:hypothetical protein
MAVVGRRIKCGQCFENGVGEMGTTRRFDVTKND